MCLILAVMALFTHLRAECELEGLYRSYETAAIGISQSGDRESLPEFNYVWAETFLDELKKESCQKSAYKCIVMAETIALLKATEQGERALNLCDELLSMVCGEFSVSDFYFDRALIAYQLWLQGKLSDDEVLGYFEAGMENIKNYGLIVEAISFLRVNDHLLREMKVPDARIENLKQSLLFFETLDEVAYTNLVSRYGVHDPAFLPESFAGLLISVSFENTDNFESTADALSDFLGGINRVDATYASIEISKAQLQDSCEYAVYFAKNLKNEAIAHGYLSEVREVGLMLQECKLYGTALELYESVLEKSLSKDSAEFTSIFKLHKSLKNKIIN